MSAQYSLAYEQMNKRLDDLRADVVAGFRRVDERFEGIDRRLDRIDERFDRVDERFDRVDERFESQGAKIDGLLRTVITWMLGQTVAIIGAIAGVAVALRH
jgi:archaellum component FlaC